MIDFLNEANLRCSEQVHQSPFFHMQSDIYLESDTGIPRYALSRVRWVCRYETEEYIPFAHSSSQACLERIPQFAKNLVQAQVDDLLELGLEIDGEPHKVAEVKLLPPKKRLFKVMIDGERNTDTMTDEELNDFLEQWDNEIGMVGTDDIHIDIEIAFDLQIKLTN